MRYHVLISATLIVLMAASLAAALNTEEKADIFSKAKAAFEEGNSLRTTDSRLARQKYVLAAQLLERIEKEGGVRNGKLYYNIGNCYFLQDRVGQAILNYRKAERLLPTHSDLRKNLQAARILRKDQIETPARKKALEILFFWHYDFSLYVRFLLFAVFFACIWVIALVRLLRPVANLRWPLAAAAVMAAALAVSVIVDEHERLTVREGVVLSEEVVARKGDSDAYSPSFNMPLHEGTEFILLKERGDWYHIELMDGRTCWIPRSSAGLI